MTFKHLGYIREYYVNGKFFGHISTEKDREETGYNGRKDEILEADIVLDRGKKIKKGTAVMTMLIEMSGRSEEELKAHSRKDILNL